jgi:signal transduction histidine kinase/iron only hydrogenase large subunit-like protein
MRVHNHHPLVTTIREKCRACYTCVRECPAKAIRISSGQAEVLVDRCIGCGNCFRVCSQGAKQVYDSMDEIRQVLAEGLPVSAMLAPSFPAAFSDISHQTLVGMIRALGFETVHEVGFGADLVAAAYKKLMTDFPQGRFIATTCPALVAFVELFHPGLKDRLAPVVSPMLAQAKVLRQIYGSTRKLVFIGPCLAKKAEQDSDNPGEINGVLTFIELQKMLDHAGITPQTVEESDFDPPRASLGALFPITRGILQAADINEDLMAGEVVAADGRADFIEAVKEMESGALDARMLEILCCSGCIMGPGIQNLLPLFSRRSMVSRYVRSRADAGDLDKAKKWTTRFKDLCLSRRFTCRENTTTLPSRTDVTAALHRMGKIRPTDELNCGACGYDTCRDHAEAVVMGLAESEMCLPYTIDQLRSALSELNESRLELAGVQAALIQSEKLASMGQLSAAIAHEINNPLGVVLMYTHILHDECPEDSTMRQDLKTIAEQTERCRKIVAGLLNFARQNKVMYQPVDIHALVQRCLKILPTPGNICIAYQSEITDPIVEMDADQMTQVFVNLVTNAVEAMPDGGDLTLSIREDPGRVICIVTDTGMGIPAENHAKIFDPFFTTKPFGKGTGLGLAVSYGIVKMHRGDIQVRSNADRSAGPTGTTMTIALPRTARQ